MSQNAIDRVNETIAAIGFSTFISSWIGAIHNWLGLIIQLTMLFFFIMINHRKISSGARDFIHIYFKCIYQKIFKSKKDEKDTVGDKKRRS